ncbi:cupin domain-containing protein [Sulfolobus tengchongensis]|uniref:Cupin domain-containing protein n=1 Tax=Sulfolobus tengchongensis TaxID=207809 RepID=A0AAX4L3D8_9CREN
MVEGWESKIKDFISKIDKEYLTTFFAATHPKYSTSVFRFTKEPTHVAVPYVWKYKLAKERLLELAEILPPEEAERRNINFVNPGLKQYFPAIAAATLPTLRGGIQMLKPGERAYTHRHTANAFRFVLESPSEGAYTIVEGHKLPMRPGDVILTPNWTWHDHHNEGSSYAIWFDGLDVITAYWLGGVFYQDFGDVNVDKYQKIENTNEDVMAKYLGVKPTFETLPSHLPSSDNPLFYYPYSLIRNSLVRLAGKGKGDPYYGIELEYINPTNGSPAFPTMSLKIRLIRGKDELKPIRRTENRIFIVFEGSGTFEIEGQKYVVEPYDVIAIPSWKKYSIRNDSNENLIVFSYSDEPVFKALGFMREKKEE